VPKATSDAQLVVLAIKEAVTGLGSQVRDMGQIAVASSAELSGRARRLEVLADLLQPSLLPIQTCRVIRRHDRCLANPGPGVQATHQAPRSEQVAGRGRARIALGFTRAI
jgi:hypothetical protein